MSQVKVFKLVQASQILNLPDKVVVQIQFGQFLALVETLDFFDFIEAENEGVERHEAVQVLDLFNFVVKEV